MSNNELAQIITEVIWSDFEAIQELYEYEDKQGLTDEIYEVLENMD